MPTCVQFHRRSDGVTETLVDLDAKMCADLGIIPDDRRMCWLYDAVAMMGMAILSRSHADGISEALFNQWVKEHPDQYEPNEYALIKKYILREYQFESWHES